MPAATVRCNATQPEQGAKHACAHFWVANSGKGGAPSFRRAPRGVGARVMPVTCRHCAATNWFTEERWKSIQFGVHIRLAMDVDMQELLRWRNDEETRRYRDDPRMITPAEHALWFMRRQASDSNVWIAEIDGAPVGNVTLDMDERGIQLGWTVAPELRKRGVGRAMVRRMLEQLDRDRCWCKLRRDNEASFRLASSCGFRFHHAEGDMLHFRFDRLLPFEHGGDENPYG